MRNLQVTFILPAKGGGGGANSVVQEATGLSRVGVQVAIAIDSNNMAKFASNYPELRDGRVSIQPFSNPESLGLLLARADIACATTCMSVKLLEAGMKALPEGAKKPKLAYYVQDYEPLFFEPDTPEWHEAYASYTRLPGALLFAKTRWICDMVFENHGVMVEKVAPSIDHQIYFPDLSGRSDQLVVSAMLRPNTMRRAPFRTARILNWVAETLAGSVMAEVFGASDVDLASNGIELPSVAINHGHLRRTEVPKILRRTALFLDLSDYQAFGRTALEAMASGCVPVVPLFGGTSEFARHGWNSFMVDPRSDAAIEEAISAFVAMSPAERDTMRLNALTTAAEFSIERAVISELRAFNMLVSS